MKWFVAAIFLCLSAVSSMAGTCRSNDSFPSARYINHHVQVHEKILRCRHHVRSYKVKIAYRYVPSKKLLLDFNDWLEKQIVLCEFDLKSCDRVVKAYLDLSGQGI